MKVLAIIPARGGSKGIPGKNLVELGGMPLIEWTLGAVMPCNLDRVVVSTDGPAIAAVARSWGADVHERAVGLSADASPIADTEAAVIEQYGDGMDVAVRLQPTSPLRAWFDIDAALSLVTPGKRVVSCTACREHPNLIKAAGWRDIIRNANVNRLAPRQKYQPYYWINGAIYAAHIDDYDGAWYEPDLVTPYIMPRERSIDIDDYTDLKIAEALLGRV